MLTVGVFGSDAGADADADTGADAGADADTGADADAAAGADADAGAEAAATAGAATGAVVGEGAGAVVGEGEGAGAATVDGAFFFETRSFAFDVHAAAVPFGIARNAPVPAEIANTTSTNAKMPNTFAPARFGGGRTCGAGGVSGPNADEYEPNATGATLGDS